MYLIHRYLKIKLNRCSTEFVCMHVYAQSEVLRRPKFWKHFGEVCVVLEFFFFIHRQKKS